VSIFIRKCFLPKSFCHSQNITREKLRQANSYQKRACKMLMTLTAGSVYWWSFAQFCGIGRIRGVIFLSLEQWFLTFFAPWTPKGPKNFHGPLKFSKHCWWTPISKGHKIKKYNIRGLKKNKVENPCHKLPVQWQRRIQLERWSLLRRFVECSLFRWKRSPSYNLNTVK